MKKSKVIKLSRGETVDYLEKLKISDAFASSDRVTTLALIQDENILAIIRVSQPKELKISKDYTTEILAIHTHLPSPLSKAAIKELIDFTIIKMHLSDLTISPSISSGFEEILESIDFAKNESGYFYWINKDLTFYTYRVTATDSDKYYYGVSHVKKSKATKDDCLNDGYFGSGGGNPSNKFRNWKNRHRDLLQKEVLELFGRKAHAYNREKELIGDLYKTDTNCLNSTSGGKDGGLNNPVEKYSVRSCNIHGEVKFQGETCMACAISKILHTDYYKIHGETKHRGGVCNKCSISKVFSEKECEKHGVTNFKGDYCIRCLASESLTEGNCDKHGLSVLRWGNCLKCKLERQISIKYCVTHGEVKHNGNICMTCQNNSVISLRICEIHGETKFQGESCCKCATDGLVSLKDCSKHGLVKHMGNYCSTCNSQKSVSFKECKDHGLTKHQGKSCCKCFNSRRYSVKYCDKHGETKFSGKSNCIKCQWDRRRENKSL